MRIFFLIRLGRHLLSTRGNECPSENSDWCTEKCPSFLFWNNWLWGIKDNSQKIGSLFLFFWCYVNHFENGYCIFKGLGNTGFAVQKVLPWLLDFLVFYRFPYFDFQTSSSYCLPQTRFIFSFLACSFPSCLCSFHKKCFKFINSVASLLTDSSKGPILLQQKAVLPSVLVVCPYCSFRPAQKLMTAVMGGLELTQQ